MEGGGDLKAELIDEEELLSLIEENVEGDGEVELLPEVSHLSNELGKEERHVVFLPSRI